MAEWKAFGFRLSQLNEAVAFGDGSAAIVQPPTVQGFDASGYVEYFDLARADVVREYIANGVWGYSWRVQYLADMIPPDVRRYLVDVLKFPEEWLDPYFASFPTEKYQPAEDYFGLPMHFGFRVAVNVCDSLVVANGAAEVDRYGAANKPYWRDAFFGRTLPLITSFNFTLVGGVKIEDVGVPFDNDEHAYLAYPKVGVATGCDAFLENHLNNGTFWVELIGGSGLYYPTFNPSYPSGFEPLSENRVKIIEVNGARYYYGWAYPHQSDFRWGRVDDLTLRYKFQNVNLGRPKVSHTPSSFTIENLRAPLTYEIAVDVEAIAAANAWEPTESEMEAFFEAVCAAEPAAVGTGFSLSTVQYHWCPLGVPAYDIIALPSGAVTPVYRGDGHDEFKASELNELWAVWTPVAPWALGYFYRVIFESAFADWTRTNRHRIDFSGSLSDGYELPYVYFPDLEKEKLPTRGGYSAADFVAAIGGNPNAPGRIDGAIIVDPSSMAFGAPNTQPSTFTLSWEITFTG
jgi:hypothetical protein